MEVFERAVKELQAGHSSEAVRTCRQILRFTPEHAETWNILGLAQVGLGMPDEAAASFERAIELGDAPDPCNNLGSVRKQQGRLDDAIAAYQLALTRDPNYADAHFNLGSIYHDRDDQALAAEYFQNAAAANPADGEARYSAGQALFSLGRITEALGQFRGAAARDDSELLLRTIATIIPGDPAATNRDVLDARRAYARTLPPQRRRYPRDRNAPLRIGYVSSFFHRENWMKPVWALINRHDRERFQVHLFSDAPASAIERGYRRHADDCFHDITELPNEDTAELIERCEIDILIDLNGFSKVRRLGLIAMKPAPVVVGWFNMYATTGINAYDFLIGDEVVIPQNEESFYCEWILRVPGSYLTFEVDYPVPEVAPCAKKDRFTFGCLASQYKITPAVIEAWCRILRGAPESRLVLKNSGLGSAENREYVRGLFSNHGVAPERVELDGPLEHFEFLKTYDAIDVALDTFPNNGGTTTTEAIWQGVPVLTFWGDRWASRTSASILRAAGLGEFVVGDVDEYVAKAVELAGGGMRRIGREELRRSVACDVEGFARNMETLYQRFGVRKDIFR